MTARALPSRKKQVARLRELVAGCGRVLILTHDNPDPDAMAAALCFTHLIEEQWGVKTRIVHGGVIGRASNRGMVSALDIPLWTVDSIKVQPADGFVVVDTQPGFGNNSLPEGANVLAVVDHHPAICRVEAPLADVGLGYGAVTTIAVGYLVSAGVALTPRLATAVCYGISSETQELGREATPADIAAYLVAFPLSDQPLLGRLRYPRRTPAFFADLVRAVGAARVTGDVLICHMDVVSAAEAVAEMADMLVLVEGIRWALCTAPHRDRLVISLRTTERHAESGELLRSVVGEPQLAGGHGMVAGGSLPLADDADPQALQGELTAGFLKALGRDDALEPAPLLAQPGVPEPELPPPARGAAEA